MTTNKGFGPQVPLCRLYERVSKNGARYLTGRLGNAKIAILKSKDTTDDGLSIWNVVLSEAPAAKRTPEGERRYVRDVADAELPDDVNQDLPYGRQPASPRSSFDDEIPF